MKVYSSQFFSFVNNNPISFYFCTAFVKHEILESCSSDMLENHADSWKACGTSSYGSLNKDKGKNMSKHSEIIVINDNKKKPVKVALIVKAASALA